MPTRTTIGRTNRRGGATRRRGVQAVANRAKAFLRSSFHGANETEQKDTKPIMPTCPNERFFRAFPAMSVDRLSLELKKVDPNAQDAGTGRTPLSLVCSKKDSASLLGTLLSSGNYSEIINIPDHEGLTPLHHAAAVANAENIDLCLRFGANPNAKDPNGRTALHVACGSHTTATEKLGSFLQRRTITPGGVHKQIDCINLLIGASPTLLEATDHEGRTPFFDCLKQVGAGVSWQLASHMLEEGASLTVVDHHGQNLVHHVLKEVSGCSLEGKAIPPRVLFETQCLFRLLINLEPQLLSQKDLSSEQGLTPFMTVCFWGNLDLIFYFLKEHCAINEITSVY